MIRAYFRRGAHRANGSSLRVADIAARLRDERKGGWFTTWVGGKEYLQCRLENLYMPGVFLAVTPPTSGVAVPALIGDEVPDA